ncbi:MAG: RNA polymerase sigma factor [Planctomycetia bacterium]|nr:RNA polymerase sigma factor [Planctomycetia bacterium]
MTEADLLERVIAGDRFAVAQLISAHEAPLLRYCRALLGEDALAQDAVQETFLRLFREGARLRDVKALFPWLLHVAKNICFDLQRKERRMDRKHEEAARGTSAAVFAPADAAALDGELREKVRDAVDGLPAPQREIVRLKLWEGLTYREIAKKLDMTLTNVSYHLGQAVKAIGGRLRQAGLVNEEVVR